LQHDEGLQIQRPAIPFEEHGTSMKRISHCHHYRLHRSQRIRTVDESLEIVRGCSFDLDVIVVLDIPLDCWIWWRLRLRMFGVHLELDASPLHEEQ
jgi:hypothetical protein